MKIEDMRERRPGQYAFRQMVAMKKHLGWSLRTWARDPADHSEVRGPRPEENPGALIELASHMGEIQRIAGELKGFAEERIQAMKAEG